MRQVCNAAYASMVENLDGVARKKLDAELLARPKSPATVEPTPSGAGDVLRAMRLGAAGRARR